MPVSPTVAPLGALVLVERQRVGVGLPGVLVDLLEVEPLGVLVEEVGAGHDRREAVCPRPRSKLNLPYRFVAWNAVWTR